MIIAGRCLPVKHEWKQKVVTLNAARTTHCLRYSILDGSGALLISFLIELLNKCQVRRNPI